MKFQRHLDGFREYLRTHHFAARTIETYGANTKRFLAFLEQRYPRIDTVDPGHQGHDPRLSTASGRA